MELRRRNGIAKAQWNCEGAMELRRRNGIAKAQLFGVLLVSILGMHF
jgi:hypothetical protein